MVFACGNYDPRLVGDASFAWNLPANIPEPRAFADNPMSYGKIELGRAFFYDKRMSGNQSFSCASCHDQAKAFADSRMVAIGSTGQAHPRNSMALVNLAWQPVLTWANPLMTRLNRQAEVPIFGDNPVELGLAGFETRFFDEVRNDATYQKLFQSAFPNDTSPYNLNNTLKSLEVFQRSIIGFDSDYDRYTRGDTQALSDSAKRGLDLFNSEDLECFHCHASFNFTNSVDHARLVSAEIDFANNGLYNVGGTGAYPAGNTGIHEVTGKASDMGRFKAPTLRNIAVTAPYMHDGSIADLDGVIDHYARGGRNITTGPNQGDGKLSIYKNSFVKGFTINATGREDLINFLKSLTDSKFLTNPKFANPWPKGSTNNP